MKILSGRGKPSCPSLERIYTSLIYAFKRLFVETVFCGGGEGGLTTLYVQAVQCMARIHKLVE